MPPGTSWASAGPASNPPPQSGDCRDGDKFVISLQAIRALGYSATEVSAHTNILLLLSLYDVRSPSELKEKPIGLNVLLDPSLRDERPRPLSR